MPLARVLLLTRHRCAPGGGPLAAQAERILLTLTRLGPTIWDVVELLHGHQLEALSTQACACGRGAALGRRAGVLGLRAAASFCCRESLTLLSWHPSFFLPQQAFYELPHPPSPPPGKLLPPATLGALLSCVADGITGLTWNAAPSHNLVAGRRPAYLLELLVRAAARPDPAAEVRRAVASSTALAGAARLWLSAPSLMGYGATIARCSAMPPADREALAYRVGNLLCAWHNLAALLRALRLPFDALHGGGSSDDGGGGGGTRSPCAEPWPGAGRSGQQDGGLAALLAPRQAEIEALVGVLQGDDALLQAWVFLLDYDHAVPLPVRHRLMLSTLRLAAELAPPGRRLEVAASRQAPLASLCAVAAATGSGTLPAAGGLRVAFEGEAAQGDGVAREWFRLIAADLADPGACLFESHTGGALLQPPAALPAHPLWAAAEGGPGYRVAGALLALALTQGCLLPGFRPAPHVWRWLLLDDAEAAAEEAADGSSNGSASDGDALLWQELAAADPTAARSLELLLATPPAAVPSLGLCFAAEDASGGMHELVPGGASVTVTAATAADFCRRMARFKLRGGHAAAALRAMRAGFLGSLPPGAADRLRRAFSAEELCQLVAGWGSLDVEEWKVGGQEGGGGCWRLPAGSPRAPRGQRWKHGVAGSEARGMARGRRCARTMVTAASLHAQTPGPRARLPPPPPLNEQVHTRYDGCCSRSQVVTWFWDTLMAWSHERRAALLAFVTGCCSLPCGGFASLRGFNGAAHPFTLALVPTEGDDRLPRASTCFNTLYLPRCAWLAVAGVGGRTVDGGYAWPNAPRATLVSVSLLLCTPCFPHARLKRRDAAAATGAGRQQCARV